jgi:hypothetical protein
MSNQFVEEAPYHPGYEDVGFKNETSRLAAEIEGFRKSSSRYLSFADVIVDFCSSSRNRPNNIKQ